MQESTHAVLSYVNAAQANLDPAILGKQVCGLIPLAFVDIVAISIFEIRLERRKHRPCRPCVRVL